MRTIFNFLLFLIAMAILWGLTNLLNNNPILLIITVLVIAWISIENSRKLNFLISDILSIENRISELENSIMDLEYDFDEKLTQNIDEAKKEVKDYVSLHHPDRKNIGENIIELKKQIEELKSNSNKQL